MTDVMMIEDDSEFASLLSEYLAQFNIKITNYEDPYLALRSDIDSFDILILDLSFPHIDGLDLCRKVRKKSEIPIIISSARSDINDKVIGLQIGADDYLPKPYDPKEMYARIMSLLRRTNKNKNNVSSSFGSCFEVNSKRHEIYYNQQSLKLTPAEYEILSFLISQHGFAVSRQQLINNSPSLKNKDSKSLDVLIGRLRTKIKDNSKEPKHIFSVRGIGYKLIG